MPGFQCDHESMLGTKRVCEHLLETKERYWTYGRRYTGDGPAYDLICKTCWEHPANIERHLVGICPSCFEQLEQKGIWQGKTVGVPEVLTRKTRLRFEHNMIRLQNPLPASVRDIQPVLEPPGQRWVALGDSGQLFSIDSLAGEVRLLAQLGESPVDFTGATCLHVSADGRWAAVANIYGQHGVVIDLETGAQTMVLDRGNDNADVSKFPLAFWRHDGHSLLVHGTDWNRLDISDPQTGRCLTDRPSPQYAKVKPPHYLDYFHASLVISPDQEWITDYGWVWHPVGIIAAWSVRRWLCENFWESEDGSTRVEFCDRTYFWDGPMCWVDNRTLAVWGVGTEEGNLIPGAVLFDVRSGKELRWFAGPKGELIFDDYLFSVSDTEGTAVWDVSSGEQLLHDAEFRPLRYHPGIHQFLTLKDDGVIVLSRLVGPE